MTARSKRSTASGRIAARYHAAADRAGSADSGGRRQIGRGNLDRSVWPREGAILLGSPGEEGREKLVLAPRGSGLGRQELGRDQHSADRRRGNRRIPRRRSRSADHHRPCLQHRAESALRPADQPDAKRPKRARPRRGRENFNELRFEDKKGESRSIFTPRRISTASSKTTTRSRSASIKRIPATRRSNYNNRTTTLEKGTDKLQIKETDRETLIDKGNDTLTISQGNQTDHHLAGQ